MTSLMQFLARLAGIFAGDNPPPGIHSSNTGQPKAIQSDEWWSYP